jgi:hypothetical protein
MGLEQVITTLMKSVSLFQKYQQKLMAHNGDNYTNKQWQLL